MVKQVMERALKTGEPVEIIYMGDKEMTQRVVDVKQIKDNKIIAYCRLRRTVRYFNIDSILSAFIYEGKEMNDLKKN